MIRIVSLTTVDEDGRSQTWDGAGEVRLVETRTEVEGKMPSQWPALTYVAVHLVLDVDADDV